MAPAPAAPPEFVEVRCAGCGETLEVEPALTEFACPDCGTQQALPPELMPPPPPRPRRALPIPGCGPAAAAPVPVPVPVPVVAPASMPCGACAALLSVPAGLARFACPLCGVDLTVDGGRLRVYLASPPRATVSVLAPPLAGITSRPSPHRRPEGQVEKYNHPTRSVHREETFSSSKTGAIHTMLARKEPSIHSADREESRIEPLNRTIAKSSARKTKLPAFPESTGMEKVRQEPIVHASSASQAQVCPSNYSVRAQGQRPVEDIAGHGQQINEYRTVSSTIQHETIESPNQVNSVEQAQGEHNSKATGWNLKRKRTSKSASGQKGKKKGLTCYPNGGIHLRRSTRLSKQPENPMNNEPVQQPAALNECNSDPLNIDKIIFRLCPSPLPQHQMLQGSSSQPGQVDAATRPPPSNHNASQGGQFPLCYSQLYPPEVPDGHSLDRSGDEQPHSPYAQFHVMHVQQEDAQRGHSLLGSVVKSSGKRRGRGHQPTRLLQPRREVDRPVLTPNIIDKWDVNPPCPKVASTITILLKQKYPGSTYLADGQQREVPPNGEVVLHWQQYPPETRDAILNEFLQRYKWAPGREEECLKLFERRAARQFANILCEEKRKVQENGGMPVSELEVFNRTHRRNGGTGEFVSERAKQTVEGFKKRMEESGDNIHPHLAWVQEVGGRNRGRYYGLTGIIDKDKVDELAKSMPNCFDIKGHRQKFTQEQVQQMINQALQGLTETWEKKFKSLEESVRGVPPLGIDPEHAPGSSAARERGQEDQSRHHQVSNQAMKHKCGILEQGLHKQSFWYQDFCSGENRTTSILVRATGLVLSPALQDVSDALTGESREDDDEEVVSTSV
ncbi:hypothetical protein BAE44_0002471 [Dichanthelium oligosanthes]|uniref:Uncharacterized protein n=1 Tax=Dichanthelium oligosanthes TaxID=888268 RepID=A0A1E5WGI1_9POAL|nr:hypothetical protein BAE44_0002471 [Dichanthelium oligosanthes]